MSISKGNYPKGLPKNLCQTRLKTLSQLKEMFPVGGRGGSYKTLCVSKHKHQVVGDTIARFENLLLLILMGFRMLRGECKVADRAGTELARIAFS